MFEQKNSQKKNWRNSYENTCRNLIKKALSDTTPEKLVLPVSVRTVKNGSEKVYTMYEFGGSFGDHGTAMLIGDAFGLPLQGKLLFHPRYNSIQASMTVWPGCIVAVASHQSGKANSAYYKITRFDDTIDDNGFGRVELTIVNKDPEDTSVDLSKIGSVLMEKLYVPNCTTAHYIEDLVPIRNQAMYRAKFYNSVAGNSEMEWYGAGLADINSEYESISCSSYKSMYNNVISRAYKVQEKNRIVFVAFCNYLVTVDENNMNYIDIEAGIPENAVMVTDARVMYSPGPMKDDVPMKLDNKLYTFIHSSELSDQRDDTTVSFFREHSERYIKDIFGNNLPTRMKASLMHYKNFKFAQCSLLITSAADFHYDMKMDRANAAPVHFEAKESAPIDAVINDAFGKLASEVHE